MPKTITVRMTITDEEFAEGWNDDAGELEDTVRATLHELIGDNGAPYAPHIDAVEVTGSETQVDHDPDDPDYQGSESYADRFGG